MEFRIMGPLEVRANDKSIEVLGTRRRCLLTMLIVHAGTPVSAGQVIEDLWEGRPPRAAAATLQSHVSALRRLLPVRVSFRYGGYILEANAEDVDARTFESEIRLAQDQLSKGDLRHAAGNLTKALARWRGPALADALGATWASVEVARLDELHGMALESLLGVQIALEQYHDAAVLGELAVGTYPLRERLWAHLMLALYRSGRQAEALRAYRRVRDHLSEELGISPSPLLSHLEEAILLQDGDLVHASDVKAGFAPHQLRSGHAEWSGRSGCPSCQILQGGGFGRHVLSSETTSAKGQYR